MTTVFVDSGAWIALGNRRDRFHEAARAYHDHSSSRLLTTNYVVSETATHLRYDLGVEAAMAFRRMLDRTVSSRKLTVRWIDPRLEREGWELLERYSDLPLSLTDATTAVVARRARVREIFGFDAGFRALGLDVRPLT